MSETYIKYLRRRGLLVKTGRTENSIIVSMYRADHRCICDECGKDYGSHPYVEECPDDQGMPFLHVLCNGDIVKL